MAINDSRGMNDELHRGAIDGSVKNMRPDSAGADYTSVVQRARQLHPANYGSFGLGSGDMTPFAEEFMPDAAARQAKRDAGIRGY